MQNLSSALFVYESILNFKFDKRTSKPIEEYDVRLPNTNVECEVRFSKIDKLRFERVYKALLSYGFKKHSDGYQLKIMHYHEPASKVRCEINDLTQIREFCKTNILPDKTNYVLKQKFTEYPNYYDNKDFNFRVAIQKEFTLDHSDKIVSDILNEWATIEKSFRYMNRITLIHPDIKGLQVDLSIVKAVLNNGALVKEKKFSTSKLFSQPETYEIEIELVDLKYNQTNMPIVLKNLQKIIRYVCIGVQDSNFPIKEMEQNEILMEYCSLIKIADKGQKITNRLFIGPSSYTLQKVNLIDDPENNTPCVLKDFCVTEKADGIRKMCFVSKKGRIYLIDTNMKVQYTGSFCSETSLFDSLLDGEYIQSGHNKAFINLYGAFDIYYYNGKNCRAEPFYNKVNKKNRYNLLKDFIQKLNSSIQHDSPIHKIRFMKKDFFMTDVNSIMESCQKIYGNNEAGLYEYEVDGIIFTSMSLGVGMETPQDTIKNYKYTWGHSFKWKPPEFNTIDFLVEVKQKQGSDEIQYLPSTKNNTIVPYKIINLFVGHDPKIHGLINPQDILFKGNIPKNDKSEYTKTLFVPTSPYDSFANICYIPLQDDISGDIKMFTENNEVIETNMIVEFKYIFTDDKRFRWVPLRVRYDKTAELRQTGKQFGNAFNVANNNWYTIHNPITKDMLTDKDLKIGFNDIEDQSVYYNRVSGDSLTVNLRKFHNINVKMVLYDGVMHKNCLLIDYAVGKGGDISKWLKNSPKFVLGIDISKDNIHNVKDGACVRYLQRKKEKRNIFDALFICGDTSKLILKEDFAQTDDPEEEETTKFVFQQVMGVKNKSSKKGAYVEKLYGVGAQLFDVGTIQFALHYMFKDKNTLHNFMKNCSDTIKEGGYLIGTCYDGMKIFNRLSTKDYNDKIEIYKSENEGDKNMEKKKIWSITKKYNNSEFNGDADSLGLTISVYQETINKEAEEYLVHFPYFIETMKQYGFEIESKIPGMDIQGYGDFSVLYEHMLKTSPPESQFIMDDKEKEISFLNKYFIFKKVRRVNTNLVHDGFTINHEQPYLNKIGVPKKLNRIIILTK